MDLVPITIHKDHVPPPIPSFSCCSAINFTICKKWGKGNKSIKSNNFSSKQLNFNADKDLYDIPIVNSLYP